MTSYPTSGAGRQEGSTTYVKSAVPLHGFAAPPKGYFAPTPPGAGARSSAATATAAGSRSPLLTANDDLPPATSPSLVPTKGRRRESIGGQLRRNVSASTAAAAGAGGALGHSFLLSSRQQPIPTSRAAAGNNAGDVASLSTSMGAAAEALSLSSSLSRSSLTSSYSSTPGHHMKQERGHTHFGQECYGPQPGETPLSPPASMLSSSAAANARPSGMAAAGLANRPSATPLNGGGATPASFNGTTAARRPSVASSTMEDDGEVTSASNGGGKFSHTQMLHKCEACAKVYRHPSCLVKHRWEHTVYWKEASKFLMSKHQQVQLLEAAAILVGMDCNARSLPEEKALWPAAVSPPSSGLLGSDKVNFDKLMAQKHARKSDSPFSERSAMSPTGVTPNSRYAPLPPTPNGSLPRGSSVGLLSPLNALTTLNLGGSASPVARGGTPTSRMRGGALNGDVQHLQLDESAERTDRSGSADDEDDDDDTDDIDTDSPAHQSDDRDTDDLGAGVEMQMEGVE